MMDDVDFESIAYMAPEDRYYRRDSDGWNLATRYRKEAIQIALTSEAWPAEIVRELVARPPHVVHGVVRAPSPEPIVLDHAGRKCINVWEPPEITPAPGEWPGIQAVLNWLTAGELDQAAAQSWLKQWMAAKCRNPERLPKVAVLFAGQPGSGKGTLGKVFRLILGLGNTAEITEAELHSRFNRFWADKFFVLANEVKVNDRLPSDYSNRLKTLIDSDEIIIEAKNIDQRVQKSKMAWMFTSNGTIDPLVLERGDRRYSVFVNHEALTPSYRGLLNSFWRKEARTEPTEAFKRQVAAFAYHLLHEVEVDYELVARPYENQARAQLERANDRGHEAFIRELEEGNIEMLLEATFKRDFDLKTTRPDWDREGAIEYRVLYAAYKEFCKQNSYMPLRSAKLHAALDSHRPPWESFWRGPRGSSRAYRRVPRPVAAAPSIPIEVQ